MWSAVSTDLTLDLYPLDVPTHEPEATIAERFAEFDARNPHIFAAIVRLFEDARDHGLDRFGVKAAFEILRWQGARTTGEPYRLNNTLTAPYSDKLVAERPDLAPMVRQRERRAA